MQEVCRPGLIWIQYGHDMPILRTEKAVEQRYCADLGSIRPIDKQGLGLYICHVWR